MGYDLHITRRPSWSDTGADISADEWLEYVRRDPELQLSPENGPYFSRWLTGKSEVDPWLDWSDGQIYAKNPPPALIEKMIAVAKQLDATVQGDDGELYESGATPTPPPEREPSTLGAATRWIRRLRPRRRPHEDHPEFPLVAGDRVLDLWGRQGTVSALDRAAGPMGLVRVRYDDGREVSYAMSAHPFTKVEPGST